ncbi:MAG: hypothetical protein ACP5PM_07435 [Acidimicrobiales bacterium]
MTGGIAPASPAPEIDGATAQPRGRRGDDGSRRTRTVVTALAPGLGAAVAYSAAAILLYHRVLFAPTASLPGCNCGDQAQEVWFLRWPLYAVSHGLNPFFSTWMNYPKGINLAVNTSSPLLGLASAPLQLTIGTVATYDVLLVVAFAASALAMCLALRRWVRSWAAAFCGGLLFGFSPYMIGQGSGHLFLVAMFIPPIVMVLLDEIVVAQRHGALRDGILLGVLLVLEYYISPEVLAMTAVVAVCGVVLYAIANWHTVRDRATHVVVAACCCAVVGAAALAYPVWMSVHGPQHIVGPPHPLSVVSAFHGDLLGPVLPTSNQLLGLGLRARGDKLVGGVVDENGMYLGLPLAVILVWFAWAYRRRGALVFFVAMAAIAGLLALGPRLVVDTRATGIPLPAAALQHLPFLEDILDVRFSLFLQLCAAVALAIGIDEMLSAAAKRRRGTHRRELHLLAAFGAPAAVAIVAIVALVPLVPASAYPARAATTPRFFTSAAIERIPPGTPVLTYPYVLPTEAEWNLTFQAVAGMRFRLFGADAFVPDGPGGISVSTPVPLAPSVVEHLLADAYTPAFAKAQLETAPGTPTPPVDRRTVAALRTFLTRYHVSTVLVEHFGLHPQTVVRYMSDALGKPVETGGVSAWFAVPRLLARGGLRRSRRTAHDGMHLDG